MVNFVIIILNKLIFNLDVNSPTLNPKLHYRGFQANTYEATLGVYTTTFTRLIRLITFVLLFSDACQFVVFISCISSTEIY